jgi:DNA-binding HxlR family transcriptional regulator
MPFCWIDGFSITCRSGILQVHFLNLITFKKMVQIMNYRTTTSHAWMSSHHQKCGLVMKNGYGQFCPIAKAAEVFATRWTPLVLRELMSGATTFNDIHHGVPLMSRTLLAERLRQMETEGLLTRRVRTGRRGHEYHLTTAGEGFRAIVAALGQWGMAHARKRINADDLDPGMLMWALRVRTDPAALPDERVVVRFEFTGVPMNRSRFKVMWLVLDRAGVDVCAKDPGYQIDLVARGSIAIFVQVFLGNITWKSATSRGLSVEGDRNKVKQLPIWLRLDKALGSELPFVHYTA